MGADECLLGRRMLPRRGHPRSRRRIWLGRFGRWNLRGEVSACGVAMIVVTQLLSMRKALVFTRGRAMCFCFFEVFVRSGFDRGGLQ